MALKARLDKTGGWVLCALRDCGQRLAELVDAKPRAAPLGKIVLGEGTSPDAARSVGRLQTRDIVRPRVVLGAAWAPGPDGVWRLTNRARGIVRRLDRAANLGVEPDKRTVARRSRLNALGMPVQPAHGAEEPREVACPACGSRQVVDPQHLLQELRVRRMP
jgi:DNA-directed RNA polymerase subunit RPC12/RpoP